MRSRTGTFGNRNPDASPDIAFPTRTAACGKVGSHHAGDISRPATNTEEVTALTKKQTKQLRAMANQLNPLLWIGKNDVTDAAVKQADETIDKHELIKCVVQDGSGMTAREAADQLAQQLGADVVQVIGNRFVLYRESRRDDVKKIMLVRE